MLKIMHSCCVWLKDEIIIVFAMLSSIAYLILMGFSNNDWMVYGAGFAAIFRVLCIPLLKATLSRKVNPTKQGVMFSNVYLFEVLSVLSGSTTFNNIYRQTLTVYRGFIFFIMAGFPVSGLILMGFVSCFDSTTIQKELVIEKVDIQVPSSENDVKGVLITQI
ncbi:lysosomal proton-coupled steroid conjugate and bile acid symporter SLC46A3-like [Mytilus edulis]